MAEFVLNVHDIKDAGKTYSFPLAGKWLAAELADTGVRPLDPTRDGRLEVRAQRSGVDIVIDAKVEADVVTDCVRCLGDAKVPVNLHLTLLMSPRPAGVAAASEDGDDDGVELSPEELAREYYVGDEIVLDEVVREHVLLEVPMQPLCAESCTGIEIPQHIRPPADFGKEAGGDPRLAPLKKIAEMFGSKK